MLALTLLVLSLPAQASLAGHVPAGVHLVEPLLLAQQLGAPPPPAFEESAPVSLQQLQVDYAALRRERPSLGGPITLVSTGGGGALLGLTYALVGFAVNFSGATPFLVLGLAFLGIGLPLAVVGAWLLYHRLGDRSRIEAELKSLQTQMRQLQGTPGVLSSPRRAEAPVPGLQLASF